MITKFVDIKSEKHRYARRIRALTLFDIRSDVEIQEIVNIALDSNK